MRIRPYYRFTAPPSLDLDGAFLSRAAIWTPAAAGGEAASGEARFRSTAPKSAQILHENRRLDVVERSSQPQPEQPGISSSDWWVCACTSAGTLVWRSGTELTTAMGSGASIDSNTHRKPKGSGGG